VATQYGNVKGIKFIEEPLGANRGGIALITFDIVGGAVYTGGTDTLQLGSLSANQAYENGVKSVATALSVVTMLQNRRRDGRTVVLDAGMAGPAPGAQAAATNGPLINVQSVSVVAVAGCIQLNLFSLATGGSAITTTTAAWDRAATVVVQYTAVYPSNNPE
jgi:hypothetical protein